MPNRIQEMKEGAYPKKKKKSFADQFAAVKYRSETYYLTQKLNREDYEVDKCFFFFNRLRFEISRLILRFLAD